MRIKKVGLRSNFGFFFFFGTPWYGVGGFFWIYIVLVLVLELELADGFLLIRLAVLSEGHGSCLVREVSYPQWAGRHSFYIYLIYILF